MFILNTIFCNQIYFGDRNRVYRYVHVFYAHCVTLVVQLDHNRQSSVLVRQSFTENFGNAANYLFVNKQCDFIRLCVSLLQPRLIVNGNGHDDYFCSFF